MAHRYFVTAIDTDSGKTLVSAILCQALGASYWKPIQAGFPRDTERVQELVSRKDIQFYDEQYLLNTPASPHAAAAIDGVEIRLNSFQVPSHHNDLIIEGAGGCLVPINDHDFVIDLAATFGCDVIVVADLYLGSINHTLLTFSELKRRNLPVKGIIFNGEANPQSERIILKHTGVPCLLRVAREQEVDQNTVKKYSTEFLNNWKA